MSCKSPYRFELRFVAFAITKVWFFLRVQVFDVQLEWVFERKTQFAATVLACESLLFQGELICVELWDPDLECLLHVDPLPLSFFLTMSGWMIHRILKHFPHSFPLESFISTNLCFVSTTYWQTKVTFTSFWDIASSLGLKWGWRRVYVMTVSLSFRGLYTFQISSFL